MPSLRDVKPKRGPERLTVLANGGTAGADWAKTGPPKLTTTSAAHARRFISNLLPLP
jgi:hypothetical protein